MPGFKPAYLIHGDDHGRISERRARLRVLAEAGGGQGGLELLEGDQASIDAVTVALSSMTFAIGRRFIIVDGVERWKDGELEPLENALAAIAPDTTVAFFAREDSRHKAPPRLADAVKRAGGDVAPETTVKPWELPKWVIARGRELRLELDPDAARALIERVGERQQRLLRELEKLSIELGRSGRLDVSEIEAVAAPSAERRAWALADALLSGDPQQATRLYLALRAQGERVPGLLYWIAQRLRIAHGIAEAIESGEPVAQVRRRLRMPGRAADRLISDARRAGATSLRHAIVQTADLELASRGGAAGGAGEDTAIVRAIQRIAA